MDRSLITKSKFMVSGGFMARDRRPPPDNIEALRARLERVQKAIDYIRGEGPTKTGASDRIRVASCSAAI